MPHISGGTVYWTSPKGIYIKVGPQIVRSKVLKIIYNILCPGLSESAEFLIIGSLEMI